MGASLLGSEICGQKREIEIGARIVQNKWGESSG